MSSSNGCISDKRRCGITSKYLDRDLKNIQLRWEWRIESATGSYHTNVKEISEGRSVMDLNIDGNSALVTASSSGLGKASAKSLAREGVDVVINGRDEERLADAVTGIQDVAAGRVVSRPGDLTDADDIEALVEFTVSEFGRFDHLVTSAGGPPSLRPLDAEEKDWYDAFDLLVMSVVRLVNQAKPYLADDGGGTITNIASRSVKRSNTGNVLSSAVRMSVVGFEKTLSKDFGPRSAQTLYFRDRTILPV